MATVQSILQQVASYINQDPTLPTGTDLTMWINLINQSQDEWSESYEWSSLKKPLYPTYGFSGSSIGLPSNFAKVASPLYDVSLSAKTKYPEIKPYERFDKLSSDKYIIKFGNNSQGNYIFINPPLASGASLTLDIVVSPSALATTLDTVTCPSTQFLVTRTLAKILSARSDPRFPSMKQESEDLLSNMIEDEATQSGGMDGLTPNSYKLSGFRIGEQ